MYRCTNSKLKRIRLFPFFLLPAHSPCASSVNTPEQAPTLPSTPHQIPPARMQRRSSSLLLVAAALAALAHGTRADGIPVDGDPSQQQLRFQGPNPCILDTGAKLDVVQVGAAVGRGTSISIAHADDGACPRMPLAGCCVDPAASRNPLATTACWPCRTPSPLAAPQPSHSYSPLRLLSSPPSALPAR